MPLDLAAPAGSLLGRYAGRNIRLLEGPWQGQPERREQGHAERPQPGGSLSGIAPAFSTFIDMDLTHG
jgi:hypothetical protein